MSEVAPLPLHEPEARLALRLQLRAPACKPGRTDQRFAALPR